MKREKRTLVMIMLENRGGDYEIVDDSVEANAYDLYRRFHGEYDHHEENGDQIFTFSAMGEIPETEEEEEALENAADEGKAEKVFDGFKGNKEKYIYFKADFFDAGKGPENFADESIDIVRNGKQVYLTYNGTIPHPDLGTVDTNVTINERNYGLSIPVEFDEFGDPHRTDYYGTVTDETGKVFDLHKDSVPGVHDFLWMDIAEEVAPKY